MKRHRPKKSTLGVSLFPFLAVLICTMGALIVLLVLLVQLARVNAAEDVHATDPLAEPDERLVEKEDYEWRRELLEEQRAKAKDDVNRNRMELSHLEEHIRELERRWQELRDAAADLKLRLRGESEGQEAVQARLVQLEEQARRAKEALAAAQAEAARRPPVYAIVPYDGPNGTHRRPIYLECTSDGVYLQPEGVMLGPKDFEGPLGAGNPLDAALRAIREYHARLGPRGSQGEPYPLLVVRPSGVEAYAAARSAMAAWDDEFGYELIDEGMQVKYAEPNPDLARLLEKVIADARSRQEILAAAMPNAFERDGDVGFVASPTQGGFVPASGSDQRDRGSREGGFGRGGDSRYVDGQTRRPAPGAAKPEQQQTVGGQIEKGHAQGVPNAKSGGAVSPLAQTRGQDWGLPSRAARSTGIIRPIRVACLRDRLIVLPERGEVRTPEVILVAGGMVDEIDTLVSKIWDRVDGWGIAVAGGYWKPILNVDVAQGADERFEELRTLLDGSGLEVQRSGK